MAIEIKYGGKRYYILGRNDRLGMFIAVEVGRQFKTLIPFEEVN